jgi:hypothetical protein
LIRQGRPGVTENRPEPAAETLLIELERCLALSVKAQIRIHLHGVVLLLAIGIPLSLARRRPLPKGYSLGSIRNLDHLARVYQRQASAAAAQHFQRPPTAASRVGQLVTDQTRTAARQ